MALKMVEALEAAIDQDFPITDAPTPLQRERAAHDAFAASRARVYVGRGHYFDHIDKHLSTHPSKPLVICGTALHHSSVRVSCCAVVRVFALYVR
jgi:hypothetical protein